MMPPLPGEIAAAHLQEALQPEEASSVMDWEQSVAKAETHIDQAKNRVAISREERIKALTHAISQLRTAVESLEDEDDD